MKIKEQTRKLAVGSTWVRQGEADVVWRDFRRVSVILKSSEEFFDSSYFCQKAKKMLQ